MPQERRLFEGQRKYESEVLCPKIWRICIKKANISDGILYFRCNLFELSPAIECWLRMIQIHKKTSFSTQNLTETFGIQSCSLFIWTLFPFFSKYPEVSFSVFLEILWALLSVLPSGFFSLLENAFVVSFFQRCAALWKGETFRNQAFTPKWTVFSENEEVLLSSHVSPW